MFFEISFIFLVNFCIVNIYIAQEYIASKLLCAGFKRPYKQILTILLYPIFSLFYSIFYNNNYILLSNIFYTLRIFIICFFIIVVANYRFSDIDKNFFNIKRLFLVGFILFSIFFIEVFIKYIFNINIEYYKDTYFSLILFYIFLAITPLKFTLFFIKKIGNKKMAIMYTFISIGTIVGVILDSLFYFKILNFNYYLDIFFSINILFLVIKNYVEYNLLEEVISEYIPGDEFNFNKSHRHKDIIRLSTRPDVSKYIKMLEMVIGYRRSELIMYKNKYEQYYENAPFIYITSDLEGKIIEVNKSAEYILQYTKRELIGENIVNLIQDTCFNKTVVNKFFKQNLDIEKIGQLELILNTKNNNKVFVSAQFALGNLDNNENNKLKLINCVMKEITHQKQIIIRNDIINNINYMVANEKNLKKLLVKYVKEINRELDFKKVVIRFLGNKKQEIFNINVIRNSENYKKYIIESCYDKPINLDVINEIFKDNNFIILDDNLSTLSILKEELKKKYKTGVIVKFVYGNNIKALMQIITYKGKIWDFKDIDIVLKTVPVLSVLFEFTELFKQIYYSENRYRNIVETTYDAIIILDEFGNIIELNNSAYNLIEWQTKKDENIVGKNLNRFLKNYIDFSLLKINKKQFYKEIKFITITGKILIIDINLIKTDVENEIKIYCVINDITEKINQELQLIQASKLATLGEMATSVAHELNQPLNNIGIISQRFLKKLENNKLEAEFFHKKTELILGQVKKASEIINHMREFGRKSGKIKDKIDINKSIHSIFELIGEQLKVKGIIVKFEMEENLPTIIINLNQLEQILLNLINNARDSMEDTETKILIIKTYSTKNDVYVEIKDTGIGMNDEIKEKIFEPFFTTKEIGKGTGLGLSISYKLIKDYKGYIEVESQLNIGSTFKIFFPKSQD